MARSLPNLNLKAFFALGEDGWNNEVDTNFLKLSTLVQGGATGIVTTKPSAPSEGTVVIVAQSDSTNPNTVAVFDDGVWKHFTPKKGWFLYDNAQNTYLHFNGTAWTAVPITSPKLQSLASLSGSEGVVFQSGSDYFTKRALGVDATGDILTRGHGDARYALLVHTHPDIVSTFNGRMGTVSLVSSDITTALGFSPQTASAILSGLASIGTGSGLLEQTGAASFSKRAIGSSTSTSILDRAAGDNRYAAITPVLTGLGNIGVSEGIVEQTGPTSFTKRKLDIASDSTSLTSVGFADGRYLRASLATFRQLTDVPTTYAGKAKQVLQVNSSENGIEFAPAGMKQLASVGTAVHTLTLENSGQLLRCTHALETVITVPEQSNVPFAIGSVVHITRASGNVRLITDASAYLDLPPGKRPEINGKNGTLALVKTTTNRWTVSGDLADTVRTIDDDHDVTNDDSLIRVESDASVIVTITADLAHHVGSSIMVLQAGTGLVSIAASAGVVLNGISSILLPSQWSKAILTKVADDTWDVSMAAPYGYVAPVPTLRADSESVTADSMTATADA